MKPPRYQYLLGTSLYASLKQCWEQCSLGEIILNHSPMFLNALHTHISTHNFKPPKHAICKNSSRNLVFIKWWLAAQLFLTNKHHCHRTYWHLLLLQRDCSMDTQASCTLMLPATASGPFDRDCWIRSFLCKDWICRII